MVLLEVGANKEIPTLRTLSENILSTVENSTLIRIHPSLAKAAQTQELNEEHLESGRFIALDNQHSEKTMAFLIYTILSSYKEVNEDLLEVFHDHLSFKYPNFRKDNGPFERKFSKKPDSGQDSQSGGKGVGEGKKDSRDDDTLPDCTVFSTPKEGDDLSYLESSKFYKDNLDKNYDPMVERVFQLWDRYERRQSYGYGDARKSFRGDRGGQRGGGYRRERD